MGREEVRGSKGGEGVGRRGRKGKGVKEGRGPRVYL